MRSAILCALILVLSAGRCWGEVSVSPVVVEALEVKKGHCFEIFCFQQGEQPVPVLLSLALFDQDEEGRVIFLEDEQSVQKARSLLVLDAQEFCLEPGEKKKVQVTVAEAPASSSYIVLFVKPKQAGIATRLAVLFLLSAAGSEEEVKVVSWRRWQQSLALTLENRGERHGLWVGELLFYDSRGNIGEKLAIKSGVILAGRRRNLRIGLPAWVDWVEVGLGR